MKKPQKKQKNGIALEFIWLVYRSSTMSKQRCFNGFPRTEAKIGQRWKFETYQKEQRAVKKLSTDLLDGVSYNFANETSATLLAAMHPTKSADYSPIQFIDTYELMRMQSKILRHGYLLILRAHEKILEHSV
jgi:hypothetical protein